MEIDMLIALMADDLELLHYVKSEYTEIAKTSDNQLSDVIDVWQNNENHTVIDTTSNIAMLSRANIFVGSKNVTHICSNLLEHYLITESEESARCMLIHSISLIFNFLIYCHTEHTPILWVTTNMISNNVLSSTIVANYMTKNINIIGSMISDYGII